PTIGTPIHRCGTRRIGPGTHTDHAAHVRVSSQSEKMPKFLRCPPCPPLAGGGAPVSNVFRSTLPRKTVVFVPTDYLDGSGEQKSWAIVHLQPELGTLTAHFRQS
ncbi:unnamed protein product, partial [Ectocarpus sp. 4 AP-2014]